MSSEHRPKQDHGNDQSVRNGGSVQQERKPTTDLLYSIEEVPPWYLCIALGLQQYLTAFGGILSVPLILAPYFCLEGDYLGISEVISTIFFVSGLCTLIQTTIGCRLPIVQGGTFTFITPTIAILSLPQWRCPYNDEGRNMTSLPELGGDDHRSMWQARIAEIQGAIMVSALFQIVIGFSGLMGFIMRFVGPLTIAPTVALMGLSLFGAAADRAASQWWIAVMTMALIVLFSQHLRNMGFPVPKFNRTDGWFVGKFPLLQLFPVLLSLCLSWLICYILTATGALTSEEGGWGYGARTDSRSFVLSNAAWFRFPYPGQWGTPTVSTAGVFGMLAGVLASMIESVGDYYACARLSGAPPPPDHAINRGIGIEGIGCMLAGAWGSGNGTTSYSENIGAIGITKVGSRRVVQVGGLIMIVLGCLGKFGALFVTIPDPVIGGMFMVMFGIISAVGLSNLQFVNMNSSRNLFILGFSLFFGLSLSDWMRRNPNAVNTGSEIADQIITIMSSTSMFVGGFFGFLLDNTIPGTEEERGISRWRQVSSDSPVDMTADKADYDTYDFPFVQKFINNWTWTSYLPFCPTFKGFGCNPVCCRKHAVGEVRLTQLRGPAAPGPTGSAEKTGYVNEAILTTEIY